MELQARMEKLLKASPEALEMIDAILDGRNVPQAIGDGGAGNAKLVLDLAVGLSLNDVHVIDGLHPISLWRLVALFVYEGIDLYGRHRFLWLAGRAGCRSVRYP